MDNRFFERPILNSPYAYPGQHWELVKGLPTNRIVPNRRRAELLSPIPKAKKQKTKKGSQAAIEFEDTTGLDDRQLYDLAIINELRGRVDAWREIKNPNDWGVTPDTARLLQHWRHHPFNGVRPFFCQVEAVETAIWLTEVAPHDRNGKRYLEHLDTANAEANPGLARLALKLATGAGKTTVMAMLIAWQTVNAARRPNSKRFTTGFLIVTPGITIKDRLRVLQPPQAPPSKPRLFDRKPDEELLSYGVPPEWLADVRGATEDTLLDLVGHLPGEAAEALLAVATGGTVEPRQPAGITGRIDVTLEPARLTASGSLSHPDAQRRFRVMDSVEDLQRALDAPWDRWTVFLHPAQQTLVHRQFSGPARVAGSAGTGKTVVALHRAVALARQSVLPSVRRAH